MKLVENVLDLTNIPQGIAKTPEDVIGARRLIQDFGNYLIHNIPEGHDHVDCPLDHYFSNGVYLREIFMPAGAKVVGRIHATEHLNVVVKGKATVITADEMHEIDATDMPYTFNSLAGTQKVVLVHEDCIWQTIHVTSETDVPKIEAQLTVDSYDKLEHDGQLDKYRVLL